MGNDKVNRKLVTQNKQGSSNTVKMSMEQHAHERTEYYGECPRRGEMGEAGKLNVLLCDRHPVVRLL